MSDNATRQDRLRDAVKWKLILGVSRDKIEEAHGYSLQPISFTKSAGFTGRGRDEEE